MTAVLSLQQRKVSVGSPTFIVAEIGSNHNGDPTLAREMVHAAAEAGADAVKFQLYTSGELLADRDRVITWGPPGRLTTERIGAMFDRLSLPRDAYPALFEAAKKRGLLAFATPFSEDGVKFLASLDVPAFKVASSDVTHLDFLRAMARTGKPVLLSVGKSTLGEADRAVREILEIQSTPNLAVLHCTASYPAPMEELNLRFIQTLAMLYPQCVVGFSDHSIGNAAAVAAVTLGARIIEKHFTLDKNLDGPDHWFSADPTEMAALVRDIRAVEAALGTTGKEIAPSEKDERYKSTRSLVLRVPVSAGTVIREEHLKVVRPGWGIHPYDKEKVLGLRVTQDLAEDTVLEWRHFREKSGE